eukprot:scaffold181105_cov33-Tisochrysis_lutea.AAC.1
MPSAAESPGSPSHYEVHEWTASHEAGGGSGMRRGRGCGKVCAKPRVWGHTGTACHAQMVGWLPSFV